MKAFLLPTLFLLLSVSLFGQAPVQEVTISNIDCSDMTQTVSFNLTWTADGVAVEAQSDVFIRTTAGSSLFFVAGSGNVMNDFPVGPASFSGSSFSTCEELIGSILNISDNGTSLQTDFDFGETVTEAIPTIGQWALMILGLLMASLGVVAISKKKAAIA